jgi:hypothetical protein
MVVMAELKIQAGAEDFRVTTKETAAIASATTAVPP